MKTLVTGVAGFIGSHLAHELLRDGHQVVGIDNLNDYYSPDLKRLRLDSLLEIEGFSFQDFDLNDRQRVSKLINELNPTHIYHLAAQAGVRLPLKSFRRYVDSNLTGFANIAIASVENRVPNFLYASSSSVYGNSINLPYRESEAGLNQVSFYGATKYANEVLAHSLSNLSITKFRGMRFFTVYGPMGRPDMAYFRLIHSAINKKTFDLYGDGTIRRDFTYVSDVIKSVLLLGEDLNGRQPTFSDVVNVGGGKPHSMTELIECINLVTGSEILVNVQDSVQSDVRETVADHKLQAELTGFIPQVSLRDGIERVYEWASKPEIKLKLEKWIG